MTAVHSFADVEQLLYGWVSTVVTARAVTEAPTDLAGQVPLVRITRIGGPMTATGFDQPTVDFDCFEVKGPKAKTLAIALASAVLYQLPGFSNPYGTVLETVIRSGPAWRPWENQALRRFGFTAAMSVHSRI